jgi:glycosyltransferase involved in cell wall biosynthesis
MLSALSQLRADSRPATRAFALELFRRQTSKSPSISIPGAETKFESDQLDNAEVTILLSLHNDRPDPKEALESIREQTLPKFDFVVVHDSQNERAVSRVVDWVSHHSDRFNRAVVLQLKEHGCMGPTRNLGIDASDTLWTLCLDADKRLFPQCAAACLAGIRDTCAGFAYPGSRKSGGDSDAPVNYSFDPRRFAAENDPDFIAIIAKEAWSAIGGYSDSPVESDRSFCRRLVEFGLWGCVVGDKPLFESGASKPVGMVK